MVLRFKHVTVPWQYLITFAVEQAEPNYTSNSTRRWCGSKLPTVTNVYTGGMDLLREVDPQNAPRLLCDSHRRISGGARFGNLDKRGTVTLNTTGRDDVLIDICK
jgi:hypothetical protein